MKKPGDKPGWLRTDIIKTTRDRMIIRQGVNASLAKHAPKWQDKYYCFFNSLE
jgi:hypothetical protein